MSWLIRGARGGRAPNRIVKPPGKPSPSEVPKALKAEEKIKSYWYIATPERELVPVDEFDFTGWETLRLFAEYEMKKVRVVREEPPHTKLMRRLEIADYEPASDPGNLRYYPKGRLIKSLIEELVTRRVVEYGAMEVETPVMYDITHPSLSSYFNRFPARQYTIDSEGKTFFLRFAACFGQFLILSDATISYRALPVRIYELTRYSFRRELRGELVGLRRLRAFTMPDCHALCRDLDQAREELMRRFKLSRRVLGEIGLEPGDYELGIRVTRDFYRDHGDVLWDLVGEFGRPSLVEMWDEKFFYFVLKWEFNFVDSLGKASALSTDQIDVENAERYGITYVDENGERRHPIILHCSPSGAIERCMYALLEKAHMRMKNGETPMLPLWLSPTQVRVIPVSEPYIDGAVSVAEKLRDGMVRADVDDRDETVQKRVRDGEREWIPYIVVYGKREQETGVLAVRVRELGEVRDMTVEELVAEIREKTKGKPFKPLPLPMLVSRRPRFRG